MKAPLLSDEEQRLAALYDYEILDTLREPCATEVEPAVPPEGAVAVSA